MSKYCVNIRVDDATFICTKSFECASYAHEWANKMATRLAGKLIACYLSTY